MQTNNPVSTYLAIADEYKKELKKVSWWRFGKKRELKSMIKSAEDLASQEFRSGMHYDIDNKG